MMPFQSLMIMAMEFLSIQLIQGLRVLSEDEIIGKPANADINEGESIHMKVLQIEKAGSRCQYAYR